MTSGTDSEQQWREGTFPYDLTQDPDFDRLVDMARRALHCPAALITFLEQELQLFKSCMGLPEKWQQLRQTPLSMSFCKHVIDSREPLVVPDARRDPTFCKNKAIDELGVVAYLGVPLVGSDVTLPGTLCVIDIRPREWTSHDQEIMADFAWIVVNEFQLRAAERALSAATQTLESRVAERTADLRKIEERFEFALSAAEVGFWDLNTVEGTTYWSKTQYALYGVEPGTQVSADVWKAVIHPDDLPRVAERARQALHEHREFREDFRIHHPVKGLRWLAGFGRTSYDDNGAPVRFAGVNFDVTERKQAEADHIFLESLGHTLLHAKTVQEITDHGLEAVREHLRCSSCFLDELDFAAQTMRVRTGVWKGKEAMAGVYPLGSFGSFDYDQPLIVCDTREDPRTQKLHDAIYAPLRCAAFLAVYEHSTRPSRGLLVSSVEPRQWTNSEVELVRSAATRLWVAIERAELIDQLEKARGTLEQHVAERTASLQKSLSAIDELLYTMAHDLRAPNRAVQGFATLLLNECSNSLDDTGREYIQRIIASATRSDSLIQDLLTYGRLSHERPTITTVDIAQTTVAALSSLEGKIRSSSATINIDRATGRVQATGSLLQRVLTQFIANAIRFRSPARPLQVEIVSERHADQITIAVTDNGIGIDPRYIADVFKPFIRLAKSMNGHSTGMGLAIVKRAAERMNGSVGVESTLGQGSRFWIKLPASGAPTPSKPR